MNKKYEEIKNELGSKGNTLGVLMDLKTYF